MRAVIVGHWKRRTQAEALADSLGAHILVDEGDHGALWNHRRALEWAAQQYGPVAVLEDDAIPCATFRQDAHAVMDKYPGRLVSFYLGTGRPPRWQARIQKELAYAQRNGRHYIELTQLVHAVAYGIWPGMAAQILPIMRDIPADFSIGTAAWRLTRQPIIYTVPSLADHRDGASVEAHPDGQDRVEKRRAWSFKDGGAFQAQGHP